jgi:predicted  nucleic acid-binding Zn-ribbon protein
MKSIRLRLTNLISLVKKSIPEGDDVYGYDGISKELIEQSLQESYNLLSNLEEHQNKFEVIFLQRDLAQLINQGKDKLKNGLIKSAESKFDDFLVNVQKIRFLIRETYVAVTEHPIRIDSELKIAKNQLAKLNSEIEELSELQESLVLIKKNSEFLISNLEQKDNEYKEKLDFIKTNEAEIDSSKENITIISEKISDWEQQIETISSNIEQNNEEYKIIFGKVDSLKNSLDDLSLSFTSELKELEVVNKRNSEQQELIQKTIEDANRAGMAGSFKKRKDELKWSMFFWQFLTIITLTGLIYLSFVLIKPLIADPNWEEIVVKLPIIASCVWLCWFSSKQYGFTARIREDYAYKYAVSMAFEGYKNAAREINDDLLKKLLELTVMNISKNPISIFNTKNNHGSPINEIIDTALEKVNIKDIKKEITNQ